MKTTLFLLVFLTLSVLLGSAYAQTAPVQRGKASPKKQTQLANRKAKKYNSPVVVDNTEALGHKIQHVSRPTDGPVRIPAVKK